MDFEKIISSISNLQAELEEIKRILAENKKIYAEIHKKLEEFKYDNL